MWILSCQCHKKENKFTTLHYGTNINYWSVPKQVKVRDETMTMNDFLRTKMTSTVTLIWNTKIWPPSFNCSDIISPYQKMPSKVFPLVLPILTNLWVFFKIPKIQKSCNIRAIFLRVVWWSKRLKWSLKSKKKHVFFHWHFFLGKTVLYDFCIFVFFKKMS